MEVTPSVHYLGVYGIAASPDHANCAGQWEQIKAERADEYGPDGAYSHGGCIHGGLFDGRGWYRDAAANGQQGGIDYNPGSRSICIMVGTDDPIPQPCVDVIRSWYDDARVRGFDAPLTSHSDYVATWCCGDPLRVTVWLINTFPPGPPGPAIRKAIGFDMIYFGKTLGGQDFCASWNGSYIDKRFNGAPVAPFGVPEDALAYSAGQIPVRLADGWSLAFMEKATATALK